MLVKTHCIDNGKMIWWDVRPHPFFPTIEFRICDVPMTVNETITLAALSCVVALVVAYLAVYGFRLSGLAAYTRLFGQVFNPAVSLIFVLKTAFFSLAVSLIPMASALYGMAESSTRTSAEMRGLVRMFALILLIEVASLVGNYY